MSEARNRILERLRGNRPTAVPTPDVYRSPVSLPPAERLAQFTQRMSTVRAEVHALPRADLDAWLQAELPARGLRQVLLGTDENADRLADALDAYAQIRRYDAPIDGWKPALFNEIDVGITTARWGIAETGTLVLWPTPAEPRLMSLAPPVHIALLDRNALHDSFSALIEAQGWAKGMPTNALLISGPSKTADIEQTLAYGIHGPKELVVLVLE